jgi:hypothetical protein
MARPAGGRFKDALRAFPERGTVASPRAVRIPRAPAASRPAAPAGDLVDHRPNVAGTQRAFRFAVLYLIVLLALDLILVALDLTSSEASRPGLQGDLRLFLAIAGVLAVGSVVFALSPAPRFVDVRSTGVVVVGRWGSRVAYPAIDRLDARVLRHYPAGFLSSKPVDMVSVADTAGRRHTYQVESGLLNSLPGSPGP